MEPTLPVFSKQLIQKINTPESITRGTVVLYHLPEDNSYQVKSGYYFGRIIALEKDVVRLQDNEVTLNGQALSEPYLRQTIQQSQDLSFTVPENSYFILPDNRNTVPVLYRIVEKNWVIGIRKKCVENCE